METLFSFDVSAVKYMYIMSSNFKFILVNITFYVIIRHYLTQYVGRLLPSGLSRCLRITYPLSLWVQIPTESLHFFMRGSYPGTLQNIGISTQMPARVWNNSQRGIWCFPLPLKTGTFVILPLQCRSKQTKNVLILRSIKKIKIHVYLNPSKKNATTLVKRQCW